MKNFVPFCSVLFCLLIVGSLFHNLGRRNGSSNGSISVHAVCRDDPISQYKRAGGQFVSAMEQQGPDERAGGL